MTELNKIFCSIKDDRYYFESLPIVVNSKKKDDTILRAINRTRKEQKKIGKRVQLFTDSIFISFLKYISLNEKVTVSHITGNNEDVCMIINMFIENITEKNGKIETIIDMLHSYIKYHDDFYIDQIVLNYNKRSVSISRNTEITNDPDQMFFDQIMKPFLNQLYNV